MYSGQMSVRLVYAEVHADYKSMCVYMADLEKRVLWIDVYAQLVIVKTILFSCCIRGRRGGNRSTVCVM